MNNKRNIIGLLFLALLFPIVGGPALAIYFALKVIDHASRDGGVLTRRRLDAWSQTEPWVTGDDAVDQEILARKIAAAIYSKGGGVA